MRLNLLPALFTSALLAFTTAAFAQAKVPLETFFQHRTFSDAAISPSGRFVGIKVAAKTGRVQLVVVDTDTLQAKVAAVSSEGDINEFHWINDKRLVFTLWDEQGGALRERSMSPGLFAVDRDGSDMRRIARMGADASETIYDRKVLDATTQFLDSMHAQESDDVFVTQMKFVDGTRFDIEAFNLLKVNTRTLQTERVYRPEDTYGWVVDHKDIPRVAITSRKGRSAMHYLDPASGKWDKLVEFDSISGEDAISPVGFAPDGTFFVTKASANGAGVFRFDLAKRTLDSEPILSAKGFDVQPEFVVSKGKLLGVRYETDAKSTAWFDAGFKQVQAKVDEALPRTINVIDVPERQEVPIVSVYSYSDHEPGTYSIYNTSTGKLTTLGRAMPAIEPAAMAKRDFVRFKARDGMEIPMWVTTPKGAGKKLPMVVLVHGGPWAHAAKWGWDPESQFLASRGYAVIEPDFRGSTGYGFQHFKAGWKQWGLSMQDDVADAAKWAIQQGLADPARICIAGASYGGYSTLMGLAKDPDLFKCGVNWVGVSDIDLMYSITWSDFSNEYTRYGMPLLVGDRQKDAAVLKSNSPLQIAEKINQPLLMAYGGRDVRVPIEHGLKFRDAVGKTNKNVEWVEYKEEGHGWYLVKNRVDFWTRVEKFLDRHIGH